MKTIQIPEGYELTDLGNGSYRIDPVKKESWEPEIGEEHEIIARNGCIDTLIWENDATDKNFLAFHNVFPVGTAKEAARQIKYAMAQARAKAIVEPEFEPDWSDRNQDKWGTYYDHLNGCFETTCYRHTQSEGAYFSTEAKAKEAIKLLEQWGVNP